MAQLDKNVKRRAKRRKKDCVKKKSDCETDSRGEGIGWGELHRPGCLLCTIMHFCYIIKSFLRTAEQQVDFVFSSWPYAAETRKAYRDAQSFG